MSTAVYLNPQKTAELEPFEWELEGRAGTGISPFSVPHGAFVEGAESGLVSRIQFDYPGGEVLATSENLDDRTDPTVRLWVSRHTQKIVVMEIGIPVDMAGLRSIGMRLTERAVTISPKAKRYSFLMIARVLCKWSEIVVPA